MYGVKVQCEPEAWYFLPDYIVEPQGNDSNKYEMISVGNTVFGGRSGNYLYTKLLCPLAEGQKYKFSIWVAPLKNEFDHLDAYFSYLEPASHLTLNAVTEVSFSLTQKNAVARRHLWTQYSYSFIATGNERYITIGNFSTIPIDKTKINTRK